MIDTIGVKYNKLLTEEEIQSISDFVIKNKSKFKDLENKSILCIKPSKFGTSSLSKTLAIKTYIDTVIMEVGKIIRTDMAMDKKGLFKDKIQLYRMFVSCLSLERSKSIEEVYNTNKWLEVRNVKIKKNNYETTVYDCSDKNNRIGNTRIETRALYIRNNLDNEEKIKKELDRYNKELDQVMKKNKDEKNSLIKVVERFVSKILIAEYKMPKMNIRYINKTEFIAYCDRMGLIMTERILEKTLKGIGYKSSIKNFKNRYRKKRKGGLNFTSRTELEKLIREIKKENKRTLER